MEETEKKRTVSEWIGYAFIGIGLALLVIEILQSVDVIQGWLDDPLTGAVATSFVGISLLMLAKKKKVAQS